MNINQLSTATPERPAAGKDKAVYDWLNANAGKFELQNNPLEVWHYDLSDIRTEDKLINPVDVENRSSGNCPMCGEFPITF